MKEQHCACPHCNCTVDANAVQQGGKAYCCEACATGHRNGERCRMGGCSCGTPDPSEQT
ncbi:metallothionein [Pseudomonas urmiensis]|uniref:Metallothionein n=1 Tax=Pseudomonas urmiensis TaxID=2745493 RepID=A0ABW8P1C8_9PSED